jgi:hypothetical protein
MAKNRQYCLKKIRCKRYQKRFITALRFRNITIFFAICGGKIKKNEIRPPAGCFPLLFFINLQQNCAGRRMAIAFLPFSQIQPINGR